MSGVGWQIEDPLIMSSEIPIDLRVRQHPPRAFTSQLSGIHFRLLASMTEGAIRITKLIWVENDAHRARNIMARSTDYIHT